MRIVNTNRYFETCDNCASGCDRLVQDPNSFAWLVAGGFAYCELCRYLYNKEQVAKFCHRCKTNDRYILVDQTEPIVPVKEKVSLEAFF